MNPWCSSLARMFSRAGEDLAAGRLTSERLNEMLDTILAGPPKVRQRLLYLHACQPGLRSPLVGSALHEPRANSITQIDPLALELPYNSVLDAVIDGWRVVHFPDQRAPFDDREIDVVGYEFILEKLESYDG